MSDSTAVLVSDLMKMREDIITSDLLSLLVGFPHEYSATQSDLFPLAAVVSTRIIKQPCLLHLPYNKHK